MSDKIKPRIFHGEPWCSDTDCSVARENNYNSLTHCSNPSCPYQGNIPCIPGIRQQRNEALARVKELEAECLSHDQSNAVLVSILGDDLALDECAIRMRDKNKELEAEVERLKNFIEWVIGATDCQTDPIIKMINDNARAILAAKEED